jgi:hypothetical protein
VSAPERENSVLRLVDDEFSLRFTICRCRNSRGDKGARSDPGYRKSVRYQSLVGVDNGIATKSRLFGQRARGWQRLAGFRDAADDGVTESLVEPVLRGGARRHVGTEKVER